MWILFPDEDVIIFIRSLANNKFILIVDFRKVRSVEENLLSSVRVYEGRPQNPIEQFSENII